MNKAALIIVIVLVVIIGGYFVFRGEQSVPESAVPVPGQELVPEKVVTPGGTGEPVEVLVREISMVSGNLFFSPKTLVLAKDQPVRIMFQNTGTHTFTIKEMGVNVPISGSSATAEFIPAISGTFEYYCAVPGHRSAGMLGLLTVE
ncbi:cupredoxin domain-containing protein [Patescibacteria group bacterium AH-259-L07]|nr:cupredoxin domain-containing protein [Patescibacteria group bacterium AH-259-L07]